MAKKELYKLGKLSFSYDADADVLYVSIGEPQEAISEELENGIFIRKSTKTSAIIGITIVDFKGNFSKSQVRSVPIEAMFQPA